MLENVFLALSAVRSNKMRSFLTMLGIIIGIGSVIGIVTVGNSLTNSFTDSMQQLGTNNIIISIQQRMDGEFSMQSQMTYTMPTEEDLYSDEEIEQTEARFSEKLDAIAITHSLGNGKAEDGRDYANGSVIGVNLGYLKAYNTEMVEGRFLNERDLDGGKRVCVVSDRFAENLFPHQSDRVGREIHINMGNGVIDSYYIVGIYEYQESSFSMGMVSEKDMRTDVYIPLSVATRTAQEDGYASFMAVTKPGSDNAAIAGELREYLNETFYADNDAWQAQVVSMESAMSIMGDVMGTISTAVAVIAAISLLVGGIGVMNIMLVSVTERTSEIGIRKALGAKNGHIRVQFIMESMILCAIGGVIGIGVGILLGNAGAYLLGFPATASPEIIVIAVLFSMVIGIFFGYYPANKAAKMDVIEALRYE